MATILRAPSGSSKGVVTFTTQERDLLINGAADTRQRVSALKSRWLVGLHHNWHDFNFSYDSLFDFSLAGEGDLREANSRTFDLLPMDACNFVPDFFANEGKPFWDVLYVARAVVFKRLPEFFAAIRKLYDDGHRIRVLCICPVPPYSRKEAKTSVYDVRERYDALFSAEEQELFTLMTMDYGYPFPFDLPTLAHFYSSSRVCVHFSDDERRARVAAYAWAAGIPMVCMPAVASLLPDALKRPPILFEAGSFEEFPARILDAVRSSMDEASKKAVRESFLERDTVPVLRAELEKRVGPASEDRYATKNLAFRLGRHHEVGVGTNSVAQSFDQFLDWLHRPDESWLTPFLSSNDPELDISRTAGVAGPRPVVIARMKRGPGLLMTVRSMLGRIVRRGN